MSDRIYVVDPIKGTPQPVEATGFAQLGVRERQDLEEWVGAHPAVLGESLLILTTEFDRFDKSDRRVDLLALDEDGMLVVVELKLDAAGSLADLQAIRYAAFCSTMTMKQAIEESAKHLGLATADAEARVKKFLGRDPLPELSNRPRIIIAAGSMDDEELTSTVLWLRGFGVDITCVELTPYRLPASNQIILVPRVIIPIPEARDYLVKVEQKEVARVRDGENSEYRPLWTAVAEAFNRMSVRVGETDFRVRRVASGHYQKVLFGHPRCHYEWVVRFRASAIDISFHAEFDDPASNQQAIQPFKDHADQIKAGLSAEFMAGAFGDGPRAVERKWREVRLRLVADDPASPALAEQAAGLMKVFIERTFPLLQLDVIPTPA